LILVGGGVRIPAIQDIINKKAGGDKINRNIDGDEAAVLGAVLHAAAVSSQFKLGVKVSIKDLAIFPIEVKYQTGMFIANNLESQDSKVLNLFNEKSFLASKKLVTLNRLTDFPFEINYKCLFYLIL
jgi:hypoxia up-regulated 1